MTTKLKKYFQTIFRWFHNNFNISKDNSVTTENIELYSAHLQRQIFIQIFLPPGFSKAWFQAYPLVLFNDGQDMEALQMKGTLERLYRDQKISPQLIVGIHAGNRIQEYGTAFPLDYQKRGAQAKAYSHFIVEELL